LPNQHNFSKRLKIQIKSISPEAQFIFWSTRDVPNASIMGPSNLYLWMEDGSDQQITFEPKLYQHAAVSYDRRYIAVTAIHPKTQRIAAWCINTQNKTIQQILPDYYSVGQGGIDWSSEGFIYFAATQQEGKGQNVYRIKFDGTLLKKITNHKPKPKMNPPIVAFASDVSVSPDGKMIAYVCAKAKKDVRKQWGLKPQICVKSIDSNPKQEGKVIFDGGPIVEKHGEEMIGGYDPEICPGNKYVIFSYSNPKHINFRDSLKTAHDIYVAEINGTYFQKITESGPVSIVPDCLMGKVVYTEYNEKENYSGLAQIDLQDIERHPNGKMPVRYEENMPLWAGARHAKWIPGARMDIISFSQNMN